MGKIVLITGGSGHLGSAISKQLVESGYVVRHLSRSPRANSRYPTFHWDIDTKEIDERAFEGVSSIIHLAGAGVADNRWTTLRKAELLHSRVDSSTLLFTYVNQLKIELESFVSASAIGYYGDSGSEVVDEEAPAGHDFLAHVVQEWEHSVEPFSLATRLVKIRIGVVLSSSGGALPKMAQPIRFCVGAPLGSGDQYMSWIHETDLVNVFQYALEQNISDTFNAVAPNPATNREVTKEIARVLKRPLFFPPIPAMALKAFLGEMAGIVLMGSNVSSKKIQKAGYVFKFPELKGALKDLLQ